MYYFYMIDGTLIRGEIDEYEMAKEEYLKNLPVCHECGKPIDDDTIVWYYDNPYHLDCAYERRADDMAEGLELSNEEAEALEKEAWEWANERAERNEDYDSYYSD